MISRIRRSCLKDGTPAIFVPKGNCKCKCGLINVPHSFRTSIGAEVIDRGIATAGLPKPRKSPCHATGARISFCALPNKLQLPTTVERTNTTVFLSNPQEGRQTKSRSTVTIGLRNVASGTYYQHPSFEMQSPLEAWSTPNSRKGYFAVVRHTG